MTDKLREAAQQALEAMEYSGMDVGKFNRINAACQALRTALAEQPAEQEPVAFSQFLADVVTAAGLLSHGKTDKALAARISEFACSLRTTPPPAKREPLTHDEDLLERLYWEFDHQRKKTGEERMAFKGKMRFYASDFRRVSEGGAAFAQSVTDDMMNLADRLGSEYDDVDPKAWKHLLVYTPQPAKPAEQETLAWLVIDGEDCFATNEKTYAMSFPESCRTELVERAPGITKERHDG